MPGRCYKKAKLAIVVFGGSPKTRSLSKNITLGENYVRFLIFQQFDDSKISKSSLESIIGDDLVPKHVKRLKFDADVGTERENGKLCQINFSVLCLVLVRYSVFNKIA